MNLKFKNRNVILINSNNNYINKQKEKLFLIKYFSKFFLILLLSLFIMVINIFTFNCNYTNAKYIICDEKNIFKILDIDTEPPVILGIESQFMNKDVQVDYNDNDVVVSAKYWYNSLENNFTGEGQDFEKNTVFSQEGWYYIKVIDRSENESIVTWLIDKTVPDVYVNFYKNGEYNFT